MFTLRELVEETTTALAKRSKSKMPRTERMGVVQQTWDAYARWVGDKLLEGKGAQMGMIGGLTLEKQWSKAGDTLRCTPVFEMAEGYAKAHNLRNKSDPTPRVLENCEPINHTRIAISYTTELTKDQILSALREMIQRIGAACISRDALRVELGQVGTLMVRDRVMGFEFFPSFAAQVEDREQTRFQAAKAAEQEAAEAKAEEARAAQAAEEALEREQEGKEKQAEDDFNRLSSLVNGIGLYQSGDAYDDKYAMPRAQFAHRNHMRRPHTAEPCAPPLLFASPAQDDAKRRQLIASKADKEAVYQAALDRYMSEIEEKVGNEHGHVAREFSKWREEEDKHRARMNEIMKERKSVQKFIQQQMQEKHDRDRRAREEIRQCAVPEQPDQAAASPSAASVHDPVTYRKQLRLQICEGRSRLRAEKACNSEIDEYAFQAAQKEHARVNTILSAHSEETAGSLRQAWNSDISIRGDLNDRLRKVRKGLTLDPSVGFDMRSVKL